jgi:hypothetical protein
LYFLSGKNDTYEGISVRTERKEELNELQNMPMLGVIKENDMNSQWRNKVSAARALAMSPNLLIINGLCARQVRLAKQPRNTNSTKERDLQLACAANVLGNRN